jgi:NosR/NirI family transcriptional regulator, nitrous oxide reductase regulator
MILGRYAHWLHTRWPAGKVEALPEVAEDGSTNVPGLWVAGDLRGVPLLKLAADSGARVVARLAADRAPDGVLDLVIVGAGVAGVAGALVARARGLRFAILEAAEPFYTIANFPRHKPIYTYPVGTTPAGTLRFREEVHPKETLLSDLREQMRRAGISPRAARVERVERSGGALLVHVAGAEPLRARHVLVAIGRSGAFRKLSVKGEDLPKVYNRLHDPAEFAGRRALVVGGGDTAVETAIALLQGGADVTLCYRGKELVRPKAENAEKLRALIADPAAPVAVEQPTSERVTTSSGPFMARGAPGRVALRLATRVAEIHDADVVLDGAAGPETLANDVVFTMIGREAPLSFFRRSGVRIAGEMTRARWIGFGLFVLFCAVLYDWKSGGAVADLFAARGWFPLSLAAGAAGRGPLLRALFVSAATPSFWYTLSYSLLVVVFGVRRIRRRNTPYVTAQTLSLMAVQVVPLFLLPEVILPWLHYHGLMQGPLADALFPVCNYGHGREFWRAYGFVLAWPLMIYNVLSHQPLWAWLVIAIAQTAVLIPLGVRYFGKGVYCGWICPCGALAETLGDRHRQKMPHGPRWNRLDLLGQAILGVAVALLVVRVAGWLLPDGNWIDRRFAEVLEAPYKWIVDVTLAGTVGLGCYFWFSGRVWCRFFCPLAALMHVYARFSRFGIVAEKKKCISCNVCTSVCHQGIDVMSFANKGLPMVDPECVRCSACVQSCPTGVLSFGRLSASGAVVSVDRLRASAVRA